MRLLRIIMVMAAVFAGVGRDAAAQRIVSVNIDSTHCVGDSLRFSVGLGTQNEVVVETMTLSISHPQHTFLPDGAICDSTAGTCTYRSPITFSNFNDSILITSAQDIDFVRINIEHSWMGDIIIALECPNGQFAVLKYSQLPPSSCGDNKFLNVWERGLSGESCWLGEPVRDGSSDRCDSSAYGNRPGVGWNYCWSENTSHGYAPEDGLIQNPINQIYSDLSHSTTDSTHIAANTHFYRPQWSLDTLIGCPINGTWNIVVQDSWGIDNGWLFDWELGLDEHLYQPTSVVQTWLSDGDGHETTANDSTIVIEYPPTDTVMQYRLRILLSNGDTLDTAFSVHWLEPFVYSETDTLCKGDTARWTTLSFTTDAAVHIRETTANGCDSIVDLYYTFMPTYSLHDTLPYCANEAFMYEGCDYGGPCTIVIPHQTQWGCDSTVTVHLITIDSAFHLQLQMSTDGEEWSADTILLGCRPVTIWLRDTTLFELWRRWDFGDGDTLFQQVSSYQQIQPFTHTYDSTGSYTLSLTAESIHGCVDSVVLRNDAVRVYPLPEAQFFWDPELIVSRDPWTHFENLSVPFDSLRFMWHFSNGNGEDTCSEANPTHRWTPGVHGEKEVMLEAIWPHTVDNQTVECIDTSTHNVVIINEYLQFPTLVTPNGDGENDRWEIVNLLQGNPDHPSTIYRMNELWIYNSWGVQVYHVRDIRSSDDFWDPSPLPDGTYYFRFNAFSPYGVVKYNGVIEVLR